MSRILVAGILSALLVVLAVSLFSLILPSEPAGEIEKSVYTLVFEEVEEDCSLIEAKVEELRGLESGGSCKKFDDCAMIHQSCSSVPKTEALKTNFEFDRLFIKAKELDCKVDYLICEFVGANCHENTCVVERRGILTRPETLE